MENREIDSEIIIIDSDDDDLEVTRYVKSTPTSTVPSMYLHPQTRDVQLTFYKLEFLPTRNQKIPQLSDRTLLILLRELQLILQSKFNLTVTAMMGSMMAKRHTRSSRTASRSSANKLQLPIAKQSFPEFPREKSRLMI